MSQFNGLTSVISNFSAPVGRLFIALIFFMSGLNKIGNYANTAGWMESVGVPGALLPLVIALEVVGGAAIILGWQTRIIAFLFAGFCLLSAIIFHADFSDQMQMGMFMKNVGLAGGFLILVVHGAGNYSIDKRKRD